MLSTKDLKVASGKTPKTLRPGNAIAKVLGISLQPQKSNPDAYFLVLNLEGEDQGAEFEGFLYDADKPELGRAKGQVGRVKFSQYSYKDMTTKSGYVMKRDNQIVRDILSVAIALGVREQLDQIEEQTIERFVDKASKILNNGKYLYWCIGGSAYMKDNGNKDYTLYLPKYDKNVTTANFASVDHKNSVTPFNQAVHVQDDTEQASQPVGSWGAETQVAEAPAAKSAGWSPSGFEM